MSSKFAGTAVIARLQLIEFPYIHEYICWYLNYLNFDHVYLVNTEPESGSMLAHILKDFSKSEVSVLDCPVPKENHNHLAKYYPDLINRYVKEDFVLNVDCDELLYLPPPTNTIQDFLLRYQKSDSFRFQWVNIASTENFSESMLALLYSSPGRAHDGRNYKMMALKSCITQFNHHVLEGCSKTAYFPIKYTNIFEAPLIFHFIARSRTHTLLKILHQSFNNLKSRKSKLNEAVHLKKILSDADDIKINILPPRVLLHIIEVLQSKKSNILNKELLPMAPIKMPELHSQKISSQIVFEQTLLDLDIPERSFEWIYNTRIKQIFDENQLSSLFSSIKYTTANPLLEQILPAIQRSN